MSIMPLPSTRREMKERGWKQCDVVILVTGDAYVDHPSFGAPLIGRFLESLGYTVGVLAQPQAEGAGSGSINELGHPRLFWGVTGGNVDSMVARYTASGRLRRDDAYTPGGTALIVGQDGVKRPARPDRAASAYCRAIRQAHKGAVIVLGGIEASMRRFSHWDFVQSKIRHSLLVDTKADILVYGMGERAVKELAFRMENNMSCEGIPGTVIRKNALPYETVVCLPSHGDLSLAPEKLFLQSELLHSRRAEILYEQDGAWYLIQHPAAQPLSTEELDSLYALPFTRRPHPMYEERIPAWEMIKDSVTAHRGCAGGCRFCGISLHQGRTIVSRSESSLMAEIEILKQRKDFSGHITDIGGPSADMYGAVCLADPEKCQRESCLYPRPCPFFKSDVPRYLRLLEQASGKVRKVSIGSGLRLDLSLSRLEWRKAIIGRYLSGYLNIAPEHCHPSVLDAMGKYTPETVNMFMRQLEKEYPFPRAFRLRAYFIAGHPGETAEANREAAAFIRKYKIRAEAVQAFTPLPMTRSAAFYVSKRGPLGSRIVVPGSGEAARFKAALVFRKKKEKN